MLKERENPLVISHDMVWCWHTRCNLTNFEYDGLSSKLFIGCRRGNISFWVCSFPIIARPKLCNFVDDFDYKLIEDDPLQGEGWAIPINVLKAREMGWEIPVGWWLRGVTYRVPKPVYIPLKL